MDRAAGDIRHGAAVDAWLARSIDRNSSAEIAALFHAGFEAIWSRAVTTLGTATLSAIATRVLDTATARHGFLSAINPRPNGDARWRETLHERLAAVPRLALIEGLRFGLIELLAVIGALTAEILSDDLHAALAAVEPPASTRGRATGPHPLIRSVDPKVPS